MNSMQCSPALQQQQQHQQQQQQHSKQSLHVAQQHQQQQSPEMFHWQTSMGARHQMTGPNWPMNNCPPMGHSNASYHLHHNPNMPGGPADVAFYESSMQQQLKMSRHGMEYSRMISPVNQAALNSGGYYVANNSRSVPGQQGMVQGGQLIQERGMPYNQQMQMNGGYMGPSGPPPSSVSPAMNGRGMMTSPMMVAEMDKGGAAVGGVGGACELKMTKMNSYSQQRVTPYMNPQQYMQNKRAQYNAGQQQINFKGSTQSRAPLSPMWTNGGGPSWPRQPPLSPSPYAGPGRQYPPSCPPQQMPSSHSPIRGHHGQFISGQASRNYEMPPFPGNPTPPTTPGAASGPPFYPMADMDGRLMRHRDPEPRLCFPVRDGQIMRPFRLEHNLVVTNHVFILREHIYQNLMSRPDVELQLKCYHNEDKRMMTNWPSSLSITLNSVPLNIERGEDNGAHQPLLLKNYCHVDTNMLQIAVSACCCSHLFDVQIVHRPLVHSVLENLLNRRLLPPEHGITKIKRAFVDNETIKLPLVCPITNTRINLPARGPDCQHIQCFDLESYLKLNSDHNAWICPICKKLAPLEVLEIDQYIWGILRHVSSTRITEVFIDSKAVWRPSTCNDPNDPDNMAMKRGISLDQMHMPTLATWLGLQQHNHQHQSSFNNQAVTNCHGSLQNHGPFRGKEHDLAVQQQLGRYLSSGNSNHMSAAPPDYLGCLSQLSNSILSDDSPRNVNNNNNNNSNNHTDHVSFPPTPMGSQMSSICTPLDGQSLHPRTPSDGHSHTSPESLLHPQTPVECILPKTPLDGSNPGSNSASTMSGGPGSSSGMFDQKKGKSAKTPSSSSSSSSPSKPINNMPLSHVDGPKSVSTKPQEEVDFSFDLNLESIASQADSRMNDLFDQPTSSTNLVVTDPFEDDLSLYLGPLDKPSATSNPSAGNGDDLLSFMR